VSQHSDIQAYLQHLSIERSKTESSTNTSGHKSGVTHGRSSGIPNEVTNIKQLRDYLHTNKGFGEIV